MSSKGKPILKAVKEQELDAKPIYERCSNCGSDPKEGQDALGYKQVFCPNCLRWECMKYPNELSAMNAWNDANRKNAG